MCTRGGGCQHTLAVLSSQFGEEINGLCCVHGRHAEYGQHGKQLQIMGATRPTRPPRHPTATLIMAASVSHTTINPAGGPVPDHTATAAHPPPLRPAPNSAATVGDYMVAGSYFYTPRIITRSGMGEECDRIVSVAAGAQFTFGVTQAGVVLAWGWDAYGCLGRGGDRTVMDFESVPALRGIRVSSISPGADHVLCITEVWGTRSVCVVLLQRVL
jgi:Regulator of chromosome condensation (RCC1) repeat